MPHVPLFSWEELGKMDPAILRTLRHLYFANYTPSTDGAMYLSDPGVFDMQKAELSNPSDFPDPTVVIKNEDDLPDTIKEASIEGEKSSAIEEEILDLATVSLTQLLSLYGMEEDVAVKIKTLVDEEEISSFEDLANYNFISKQHLKKWEKSFT